MRVYNKESKTFLACPSSSSNTWRCRQDKTRLETHKNPVGKDGGGSPLHRQQ